MRLTLPVTLLSTGLNDTVAKIRERIDTTSEEAVTGRYSDLTTHLSGRIGSAMLSQKAMDDLKNERTQLSIREARLDIAQQGLTVIHDDINTLNVRMQNALGSGDHATREAVVTDAQAALDQMFLVLNSRHGERYLFAGDATATKPFADVGTFLSDIRQIATSAADADDFATQLDAYFNTPGAGWQQNVYAGTATASDPGAVTGMDPAITKIAASLAIFALSGSDEAIPLFEGNSDAVQAAATTLTEGQGQLTNVRADRGVLQSQLARSQESLNLEETILTATFNQMTGRDQYEAASELRQLETSLEASYTLTARLANLSLLNFLR